MKPIRYVLLPLVALLTITAPAQERKKQPVPTYTIEIRGVEVNDFSVSIEGSYKE